VISNLQVLRALAALAVVFAHTCYPLFGIISNSFSSVSLFFVISGCIMAHIVHEKHFLARRLIRIVPLYWIFTLAAYACPFYPHGTDRITQGDAHTPAFLLTGLFFLPYFHGNFMPILNVGWTLNLEMLCYALLALSLRVSRKWALPLTCALLIAIKIANAMADGHVAFLRIYATHFTTFFMIGIGLHAVWRKCSPAWLARQRKALIILTVFVSIVFVSLHLRAKFVDYTLVPLLVFLALLLHSAQVRCTWKPVIILGNASYSLYVAHQLWLAGQLALTPRWPWLDMSQTLSGMLVGVAMSTVLGVLVHYGLEKPLLRRLRRSFLPGEEADAGSTPNGGVSGGKAASAH
jgi:exopolysaccharide production protein ExoZ